MARLPWLDPNQLARTYVPPPEIRELKIQVSQRASMVKQLVELKNQDSPVYDAGDAACAFYLFIRAHGT